MFAMFSRTLPVKHPLAVQPSEQEEIISIIQTRRQETSRTGARQTNRLPFVFNLELNNLSSCHNALLQETF